MTDAAMIGESLRLMLIGMGVVFSFLLLLVALLRLMSAAVARFAPAENPAPVPAGGLPLAPAGGGADATLIAVLTAAVARYRAGQRPPGA